VDPLRLLRRLVLGNDRTLARKAQARRVTPDQAVLRQFRREFRTPASGKARFIVFGSVAGPGDNSVAIGLPLNRLVGERGTHVLDCGPSRSGKTRLALSVVRQALRMPDLRVWTVDPKGDLTVGRERIQAAEAERPSGARLIERLRVLRLFDRSTPPPLRLTAREDGIPIAVQAASIGTALGEASGAELGSRMGHILHPPAELAVEQNRPLTCLLDWLRRPATFAAAAASSSNERLRHFATHELPRENKESLRALVARLERVLLLPSVRRALEAPTCFNFHQALEYFDLILDASNPPAGEEAAVRMLCGPLFGRMARAVLNREVTAQTTPVLCFIDELPELLGRFEAEGIGRLVSLAGSRLVNFFLILQDRVQLGPELFHLLRTNCQIETLFRPAHRDAELVAHALPVPEGVERPAQVREALVRMLTRLPRRQYLFWCKDGRVPAHFVTAPLVDLDQLPPAEALRNRLRAEAETRLSATQLASAAPTAPVAVTEADAPTPVTPVRAAVPPPDDEIFPSLG
jgi:hypothetical protein